MAPRDIEDGSAQRPERESLRRVIGASVIGTSLEWYDFFLYASAAALVFPALFFPSSDPLAGTLLSFGTFAVGFIARPIGAVAFGHFGDRLGRKRMLVLTLLIMGVATFLIGLLPGYETLGVAAPLLLVALRFVQGLGLGGEWGGAVLMATEHGSHTGRRGLYGAWVQVGVPVGNLLSTGLLAIFAATLSDEAFLSWGWRIPFLLSAALVLVGLYIRLRIAESPLFQAVEQTETKARMPIVDVLRVYPRSVLIAVGTRAGSDITYYVVALYILTYATDQLGLSRGLALNAVLAGAALQLVTIPLFGALSDRVGRRPVTLFGAVGSAVWIFVFFPLLDTKSSALIVLAAVVALFFHAAMWAPLAAFISELFGTRVRYSGASLGFQLAGVVGGGLAPLIAVSLFARFDSTLPVSIYVAAALAITVLSIFVATETSKVDLEEAKAAERSIVERPEAFGRA